MHPGESPGGMRGKPRAACCATFYYSQGSLTSDTIGLLPVPQNLPSDAVGEPHEAEAPNMEASVGPPEVQAQHITHHPASPTFGGLATEGPPGWQLAQSEPSYLNDSFTFARYR